MEAELITTAWPDAVEQTPAERAAGMATACQCDGECSECTACEHCPELELGAQVKGYANG